MEAIITKKDVTKNTFRQPLKLLVRGWTQIPHSYAIICCFQIIHLYLNYGPDGKIKRNAIDIYIEEAPYFNPEWNNKKKWVYSEEYNNILKNLKVYNNESIDIMYSVTYPYNINETLDIFLLFYILLYSFAKSKQNAGNFEIMEVF